MKPNFILELSQDGIRLRAAQGGKDAVLGSVALSESDFDDKVAALRNNVAEKSDTPMATELRIPDSEILYTTLDDPEFDSKTAKGSRDDLRDAAVRDALEGMTPYSLADLNFVWKVKGKGELTIAAVAHATLAEAEQFAASRGFNPVRFAADPGAAKYNGMAVFGPTALQRARAAAEADARIKAEIEARAAAEAEAARDADALPPPVADAVDPPEASAHGATTPPPAAPVKGESASALGAAALDMARGVDAAGPSPAPASPPATTTGAGAAAPRRLNIAPAAKATPREPETPKSPAAVERGAFRPKDAPAPDAPRVGFSQPRVNDPLPPLDDSAVQDDVPAMPALSFASRRKPDDAPSVAGASRPGAGALSPGIAADDGDKGSRLSRIAARFAVAPGADSLARASVPPPPPRRSTAGATNPAKTGTSLVLRGSADKPGMAGPRSGAVRATPAIALPDTAAAVASLTPRTAPTAPGLGGKLNEAEAMTVFGARTAPPGRSFTPLIIAIALAAALAVAVWAAFLLMGDQPRVTGESGALPPGNEAALELPETVAPPEAIVAAPPPETIVAAPPATPETPAAEQPAPDTSVAALPGAVDPEDSTGGRISVPDSTVATLGPAAPVAPAAEALPLSEAAPPPLANDLLQRPPAGDAESDNVVGRYATTGVWVQTPEASEAPGTDRIDDIYIASVDPSIARTDGPGASALSAPAPPDTVMPQLPPAPPGQAFDLDERGLVRATPEGALSPDGIVITAGPPPLEPPGRPARPGTLIPTAETQPDLPRTRPRDRPGDLAGDNEQSRLDLPDSNQFAALQPRPRPADIAPQSPAETVATEAGETIEDRARLAAIAVTGASTATPQAPLSTPPPRQAPASLVALSPEPAAPEPEPETAAAAPAEPISPYAVAASRLPRARPGDFERTVAQARVRTPEVREEPQQPVTRVAAPAAVTDHPA